MRINTILCILGIMLASAAFAGKDTLPNGKPFQLLQTQISSIVAHLETLEEKVTAVEVKLAELESKTEENADLILALQNELSNLNAALQLKQDILDGRCPNGQALVQIDPDGGILCGSAGSGTGTLRSYRAYGYGNNYGYYYGRSSHAIARCPSGYILTGGGFYTGSYDDVYASRPHRGNSWIVQARNNYYYSNYIYSYAICLRSI